MTSNEDPSEVQMCRCADVQLHGYHASRVKGKSLSRDVRQWPPDTPYSLRQATCTYLFCCSVILLTSDQLHRETQRTNLAQSSS
jgi:hypothetical protein